MTIPNEPNEPHETTGQDRKLQDDLKESAHRIWLAGLGALAAAEQEGAKVFSRLVERGKEFEAKGRVEVKDQVERAKATAETTWDSMSSRMDEMVTSALHRMGVPTREEIRRLTLKVEELNAKIESIRPRTTPATGDTVVTPDVPTPNPDPKIIV
jgi:poly(hydroxyalkanoate) granule-associated protein